MSDAVATLLGRAPPSHTSDEGDVSKEEFGCTDSKGVVPAVPATFDSAEQEAYIDPAAERRLVRKQDLLILPAAWIAYLLCFIDRTNLGNAKVAGLETSLGLHTYDFNIGACLYYVIYLFLDIPCGLAVKQLGFWLVPAATLSFGIVTLGTAFIETRGAFFAVRLLLGITEAFTMPGCLYMLTRYYRRSELTVRIGAFMLLSGGCASAFGGLLASAFISVKPIHKNDTWRNIFFYEGIITTCAALLMFWLFPADPAKTRIFSEEERALSKARFFVDQPAVTEHKEAISFKLVWQALSSPVTLLCTWMYICNNITVQGLSIFTVTILRSIYPGKTTVQIQLYAVPPPVVGVAFALGMSWLAQRWRRHGFAVMFSVALALVGYSLWYHFTTASQIRYAALFLTQMAAYAYGPIVLSWATANASPDTVRAVTTAAVPGFGNIGSIAATWSYINTDASTGYRIGNILNLATGASVFVLAGLLYLYLVRENKARNAGKREYRLEQKDVHLLGSQHPDFSYIH